jgi:subtilisin family serine protease
VCSSDLVLLAAPSGDSMSVQEQRLPAIISTDISGSRGYSQDDYTNTFQGTSASTPMASGVAALMLQERPELSWRDVRWILAKTARPAVGVTGQASPMTTNGFHPRVGFGRIDAAAAVNMARSHTLLPTAKTCSSNPSTVNKDIPNNSNTGISYQFNQAAMGCNLQTVEYVTVDLAFNHGYTGDLEVVLQSPAGTNSTLTSPHLCNRFWQSYTEQTVSHTVEITLTASGAAVYAGVLRIGSGLVLKNPRYGLSEGRRDFSIVKELNNGAYYIRRRPAVRTYNIAFDTLADSGDYYDFAAVYDDKGPEPIAVLVAENMDNNEFAIFGHIIQPFSGNYANYGVYNMSYQITEAV